MVVTLVFHEAKIEIFSILQQTLQNDALAIVFLKQLVQMNLDLLYPGVLLYLFFIYPPLPLNKGRRSVRLSFGLLMIIFCIMLKA